MTLDDLRKLDLPDEAGVYEFIDPKGKILYIGKATSLRSRVRSYFAGDIHVKRSELIAQMVVLAKTIKTETTESVLEALILEANLIKKHQPKFNSIAKDDKSFNYVVITKEKFPRVLVVRGKNVDLEFPPRTRKYFFGPFPHGLQLREAMKLVRKIFPYRDTCTPAEVMLAAKKRPKSCFNQHIGLCPGVCDGSITSGDYARNIRHIALLFTGHKKKLLLVLEKEMHKAADDERFEDAQALRKQIYALTHIRDVSLIKDEFRAYGATPGLSRIEAYDAAHLQGDAAVGVMVVVESGETNKAEYRLFTLKKTTRGDDPGALREILIRRLQHDEWPLPTLIVVDGSSAQLAVADQVLHDFRLRIPVVGVVKDERHRPREIRGAKDIVHTHEKDILLANHEAHRFAITHHRRVRRRQAGVQ